MVKSLDLPAARDIASVFLDRDGVINRKMPEGQFVKSWRNFEMLPGVAESIGRLNHAGMRVFVVSNQRGIALGHYTAKDVDVIHQSLQKTLIAGGAYIDGFYFCPHDRGQCRCRKPLTGLFDRARTDFPTIEATTSVMIGDSLSDVQFGQRAGMYTIFILGAAETRKPGSEKAQQGADASCTSLREAVDLILSCA